MKTEVNTEPCKISKLKYWYRNIPEPDRKTFRKKIIELCEITARTFYEWLNKKIAPKIAREIISEVTGIKQEDLYKQIIFYP